MNDPLENMQNQLHGNIREVYSETTVRHIVRPHNAGSLPDADGFGSLHSDCGEGMDIWLKVRNGMVEQASFWTDGCAATIACGSMATELATGKQIAEALAITPRQVADALDRLPEGNFHCAQLAADTLRAALRDHLALKREPWKKTYRSKS